MDENVKTERHGSKPTVAMPRQVHVLRMVGVPSLVILKMSSMEVSAVQKHVLDNLALVPLQICQFGTTGRVNRDQLALACQPSSLVSICQYHVNTVQVPTFMNLHLDALILGVTSCKLNAS